MNLQKWLVRLALLLVLVGAAAWLAYSLATPRLLSVSPAAGAVDVPAASPLVLTFSRPVQLASVEARLSFDPPLPGEFQAQGAVIEFTPARPWPSGQTVRLYLAAGVLAAPPLTLSVRQEYTGEFRVRAPRLAYLYPASGPAQIYLRDLAVEDALALTSYPGGVQDFSVAPSGEALYFSLRLGQAGSEIYRLLLASRLSAPPTPEPAGWNVERVLECPQAVCRLPAVSPDEAYLAYERTPFPTASTVRIPQVWLLDLQQSSQDSGSQPFLAGAPAHQTLAPQWSADGWLSFYDTTAAAYILLDVPSGQRREFPNQTGADGAWQPDGAAFLAPEIFFLDENISPALQNLDRLATSHLIWFDRQTGETRDLTIAEDLEDTAPAFSPDGRYLAFARKYLDARRWTPGRQLWLLHLGVGEAQALTNAPDFNHFEFTWDPSGALLAFVRFDQTALTLPPEVWVIDPFTSQATRIMIGGYAPLWIP